MPRRTGEQTGLLAASVQTQLSHYGPSTQSARICDVPLALLCYQTLFFEYMLA